MPKKSIYRQPGAQHFQLVHRSQRDPLVNDPEASQRVFVPIERANDQGKKQGNTLASLAQTLSTDPTARLRPNEGEASAYGIYYDDSSYDYMQHLRPIGMAGGDTVLLEAPAPRKGAGKGKGREAEDLFKPEGSGALPDSVMPSSKDRELTKEQVLAQQSAIPAELSGFQPDMDPHLRQVLEALDDDAFVVNEDGEDEFEGGAGEDDDEEGDEEDDEWLDELLGGGEVKAGDRKETFEFAEWGVDEKTGLASHHPPTLSSTANTDPSATSSTSDDPSGEESWEARFSAFKAAQSSLRQAPQYSKSEMEGYSEAGDTLGDLPALSVVGGKKRRKADGSQASGYSMSSSSMFRNKGLSTLDEMFDKVEREYEDDDDFPDYDDDEDADLMSESGYAPSGVGSIAASDAGSVFSIAKSISAKRALRAGSVFGGARSTAGSESGYDPSDVIDNPPELSRDDFESIMDDFLDKYEVIGRKMVPVLEGESGADKFGKIRRALAGMELEDGGAGDGEIDVSGAGPSKAVGLTRDALRERILRAAQEEAERAGKGRKEAIPVREIIGKPKESWDAETILSTYSNLENHPRLISVARKNNGKQKAPPPPPAAQDGEAEEDEGSEDGSGSDTEREGTVGFNKVTVKRSKGESTEDKKARKAAVKADRAARRVEKKTRQETFGDERKKQIASHKRRVGGGGAADVGAGLVRGSVGVVSLS